MFEGASVDGNPFKTSIKRRANQAIALGFAQDCFVQLAIGAEVFHGHLQRVIYNNPSEGGFIFVHERYLQGIPTDR